MTAHDGLQIVYNVLVVDHRRETRTRVRDALQLHPSLRVVGIAADLARASAIAKRKDLDIVVIGHVGTARPTASLTALRRLTPYARIVLFATDLPEEIGLDLTGDTDALVAPDIAALIDAVAMIAGLPLIDLDAEALSAAETSESEDSSGSP